jgi:hypothetical protein
MGISTNANRASQPFAAHKVKTLSYSSNTFFLCFTGFKRLSGITRSLGGGPANSRARRRASFAAENFGSLRLFFSIAVTAQ